RLHLVARAAAERLLWAVEDHDDVSAVVRDEAAVNGGLADGRVARVAIGAPQAARVGAPGRARHEVGAARHVLDVPAAEAAARVDGLRSGRLLRLLGLCVVPGGDGLAGRRRGGDGLAVRGR